MEELRFVIADDHEIVRVGLRSLIEMQPGWKVVGEARNGEDQRRLARIAGHPIALFQTEVMGADAAWQNRSMAGFND